MLANAPHGQAAEGTTDQQNGKGGGKRPKKQSATGLAAETKNGKKVCFAYNNPHGCNKGQSCNFAHACSVKIAGGFACGMDHTAAKHDESRHGKRVN